MTRKFHHFGIPTTGPLKDERHIPHLKMYVGDYTKSEYSVEWMRFEDDADYPELIKTVPHVAFEVDDLEAELVGKNVIVAPTSPSDGVIVAMIEDSGAPIELMQIDHDIFKG